MTHYEYKIHVGKEFPKANTNTIYTEDIHCVDEDDVRKVMSMLVDTEEEKFVFKKVLKREISDWYEIHIQEENQQ